jgi:hypothetical protein
MFAVQTYKILTGVATPFNRHYVDSSDDRRTTRAGSALR